MGYGKRIDMLCSLLERAKVFADVGCDHGYCSEYMLENGLCERAILSDVSAGSLKKAERLLADYIRSGQAVSVLGDGFKGVGRDTDEVLIAGMGGHEIVSILSHPVYGFIPERFVFQPMHDAELLRRYLLSHGAVIERDFTFKDGKFYDVIKGRACGEKAEPYTETEFFFGRENLRLKNAAAFERAEKQLKNLERYLSREGLSESSREDLENRKKNLERALYETD